MPFKKYYFYSRVDSDQEPIRSIRARNRKDAAVYFSKMKRLPLKSFLKIYGVSR